MTLALRNGSKDGANANANSIGNVCRKKTALLTNLN
jgi:hypothetical protein